MINRLERQVLEAQQQEQGAQADHAQHDAELDRRRPNMFLRSETASVSLLSEQ